MIGTTLSHYHIAEKLGEGGMGVVYRAEDTNLNRQVAIKVLPDIFSGDPERMARFEREAKLLASLNHPNIAAIHGLEETGGKRFLVLELVEGETLAQRIAKGPLPVDEALEVCRQIAEGVEAAHEKGVIHRDLKPANVKITPEGKVKVLDFGLAKAFQGEMAAADASHSPTLTDQMTRPGTILGTAAYMAPEQAKGKAVDRRADIWAFGCILYECLTGRRPFQGDTVTETLASILKGEPDWKLLLLHAPVNVRNVLQRCLQKDPKLRTHDIADAWLDIEAPVAGSSEMIRASRRLSLRWLVSGAIALLLAAIFVVWDLTKHRGSAPAGAVVKAVIKVEPDHWLDGIRRAYEAQRPTRTAMAISSNGNFLVYSAIQENPDPQARPRLYLRKIDQLQAQPIPGTEGAISPFLSPDDRWIGFWANRQLKKVPVEGGLPSIICDAAGIYGASWGRDNNIIFAETQIAGLTSVSADGGKPESLTVPDPKREEASHRLPFSLPSGRAVLFTVMRDAFDTHPRIALLQLETREWRTLLDDAADPKYVASGYLVFLRQGTLYAARFDPNKRESISQTYPVVANIMQALSGTNGAFNSGAGQFAISDSGAIVYSTGGVLQPHQQSFVWVDQKGGEQQAVPIRLQFYAPRLSPDGQRIAYAITGSEWRVGVYDLSTGTNTMMTASGRADYPIWIDDGKRLLFSWRNSREANLYLQPYDASLPMERITSREIMQFAGSWARNTNTVAFVEYNSKTGADIGLLELGSRQVRPFQNSEYDDMYPDISPDNRWIAYSSNESKLNYEVYIRPFSGTGGKWQISNGGGVQPLWSKDGKQLFYRWQDQMWVVDIETDGGLSFSNRRMLFERPGYLLGDPIRSYDLSHDGQRFLMVKLDDKPSPVNEMVFVQNWLEELKRLVPVK